MDTIRIDCRKIPGDGIEKSDAILLACDCFNKNGYAILDHVLDVETVEALRVEFQGRYEKYLEDREYAETIAVGKKRFLVPIELSGRFADPLIYGNPFVLGVVRGILDTDAVLDTFGAVVSLSGSERQHNHRDASVLFDAGISAILPAHAMTVALPLVDMNARHGTTAIWPGSHRWTLFRDGLPVLAPDIPAGSAFIWDYRLFHHGTPNISADHRPMLYGTYARSWYRDASNFRKTTQRRLWLPEGFIAAVPKDRRRLFAQVP